MIELTKGIIVFYCVIYTIACFYVYHSIFRVYYFDLLNGLFKEFVCCVLVGFFLAAVTMMFSTYIAIGIVVVGILLSLKVGSSGLRSICIVLSLALAVVVFITGKTFNNFSSERNATPKYQIENATQPTHQTELTMGNNTTAYAQPYIETPITTSTPPIPEETHTPAYTIGYVVHTNEGLNIRSAPGAQNQLVGRLMPNAEVKIYEQADCGTSIWGRTDDGWVSMDYISTDPESVEQAFRDQLTDAFDIGYVRAEGGLNIRSGPGVSYNEVGRLANGESVTIFEYRNVSGTNWGRIDRGWISMDYITSSELDLTNGFNPDQFIIDSFVGSWLDEYNQRCYLDITCTDGIFYVQIVWGNGASSTSYWSMSGTYDYSLGGIPYSDCEHSVLETSKDGSYSEVIQYTNGQGLFHLEKPYLFWDDYNEGVGNNCKFHN